MHIRQVIPVSGTAALLKRSLCFNRSLQVITLLRGKRAAIDVPEDAQEVACGLATHAQAGRGEAVAKQILS